jgi:corrinoid protein of di/trimethylamine methyltransferase
MANQQEIFKEMNDLIIRGEDRKAAALASQNLESIEPLSMIENGLTPAMDVIGERFGNCEIFLPEMIKSANAFEAVMAVLDPRIRELGQADRKLGIIVIGTVAKDVHEIGKNIVATMLSTAGFEVHDIGYDKPAMDFIQKAGEVDADIIAASALMSTTLPYQKDIVDMLESTGKRDRYKIIVGGGAVTPEWADKIRADGYAEYAPGAVKLAKSLMADNEGQGASPQLRGE